MILDEPSPGPAQGDAGPGDPRAVVRVWVAPVRGRGTDVGAASRAHGLGLSSMAGFYLGLLRLDPTAFPSKPALNQACYPMVASASWLRG